MAKHQLPGPPKRLPIPELVFVVLVIVGLFLLLSFTYSATVTIPHNTASIYGAGK